MALLPYRPATVPWKLAHNQADGRLQRGAPTRADLSEILNGSYVSSHYAVGSNSCFNGSEWQQCRAWLRSHSNPSIAPQTCQRSILAVQCYDVARAKRTTVPP